MEKVAFVSYADGGYVKIQKHLLMSIHKYHPSAVIFAIHSTKDIPNCPTHKESPYAFKVYAIEYVRSLGYDIVIWLDSPYRMTKPIDDWIAMISKIGIYIQRDGWACGQWANDRCLNYFGVSRDEAMKISSVSAGLQGYDFRHPNAVAFFDLWKKACQAGMFVGQWKNDKKTESQDERCLGHRHDQSCAELCLYKLGIEPQDWVVGDNKFFKDWITDY